MRIQKICLLIGALLCSSLALATEHSKLTGTGTVTSKPEFVEVTVSVSSVCYSTAEAAMEANNVIVSTVDIALKNAMSRKSDFVHTQGGYTSPYEESTVDGKKTLCSGYQKQNSLTLRTSAVDGFEVVFAGLQSAVLKLGNSAAGRGAARTSVSMGEPQPGICEKTRQELEFKALTLATNNAIEKMRASVADCKDVTQFNMDAIDETPRGYESDRQQYNNNKSGGLGGSSDAPIDFSDLEVTKYIMATFSYESPVFKCLPK